MQPILSFCGFCTLHLSFSAILATTNDAESTRACCLPSPRYPFASGFVANPLASALSKANFPPLREPCLIWRWLKYKPIKPKKQKENWFAPIPLSYIIPPHDNWGLYTILYRAALKITHTLQISMQINHVNAPHTAIPMAAYLKLSPLT